MVFIFPNVLLVALTAASLAIAALSSSLLWFNRSKVAQAPPAAQQEAQFPQPLTWELIAEAPADRPDLYISDQALSLIGPDYEHVGDMPANFVCAYCGSPEDVKLRLYHHKPSHTMILLSRHNCRALDHFVKADTVQMPAAQGVAHVQNPPSHF